MLIFGAAVSAMQPASFVEELSKLLPSLQILAFGVVSGLMGLFVVIADWIYFSVQRDSLLKVGYAGCAEPKICWRMPQEELVDGSRILIEINTRSYKRATGKIDFGSSHQGWLFSIAEFAGKDVVDEVKSLILRNMSQPHSGHVAATV